MYASAFIAESYIITLIVLPHDNVQSLVFHENRLDILSVPYTVQCVQYGWHLTQYNSHRSIPLFIFFTSIFCSLLTFLATTSAAKLCLEMTHNARVQLFLSVDFITKEQSADNISKTNFSKWRRNKIICIILQNVIHC